MASHQRVLVVGDEGVILYAAEEKGVGREASVSWAAPDFGRQLQHAFGKKHRDDAVVVLFNESDQTYRKEENILVSERQQRLETAFPNFPHRAALEIFLKDGDKAPETRDPKTALGSYLFVGLPENERLGRLGGALDGAGVPVAGFGVLPVESAGLVETLAEKVFPAAEKKSRWALIAGQHETGGQRQVIIKDGNLALTRLFPVVSAADSSAAAWAETTMTELNVAMVYLRRFGYIDADGMDAMVLCGEAERKLFEAKTLPGASLRALSLSEALRHLGRTVTGQEAGNNFADALYAAWTEQAGALKLEVRVSGVTRESRAGH